MAGIYTHPANPPPVGALYFGVYAIIWSMRSIVHDF